MPEADLILTNANIITIDPTHPCGSTLAVKNGNILAVSESDNFDCLQSSITKVIDCQGYTILPGFHDAHCHPVGLAESLISPDLSHSSIRSITDIQQLLKKTASITPEGNWIRARGYNEFYLPGQNHPTRYDLDKVTTNHPIKLTHRTGHAHVLNSLGLGMAGIYIDTPEPPGGVIDRDAETGEPTGILYEMGTYLNEVIPPLHDKELERGVRLASQQLISHGITSVQDASVRNGLQRWQKYQQWKQDGFFIPRIGMMIGSEAVQQFSEQGLITGTGDDEQTVGAVKIILHEATGQINYSENELCKKVRHIHKLGYQVAIHAVTETAVEAAYQALKYAIVDTPRHDHRHRIEHCSVCKPDVATSLHEIGVVIATQPAFIYYNGERYLETVPSELIDHLYPVSTLIDAGITVAASSDCPVVSPDPMFGIYAAVSRQSVTGQSIAPQQAIHIDKALALHTIAPAYAQFTENIKGSITPGKLADLVILSKDPLQIAPDEIREIEVFMTILGGQIEYQNGLL